MGSRVVRAADKVQRPARGVRVLTVRAYALRPGADAKELFARSLEAAEKADADKLPAKTQRELWVAIIDALELRLVKDPATAADKKRLAGYLFKLASIEEGQERGRRYQRAAELALAAEDDDLLERVLLAAKDDKAGGLSRQALLPWGQKLTELRKRLQEMPPTPPS